MENWLSGIVGGFCTGLAIGLLLNHPSQSAAQQSYTICIANGTPRETCIKNYLLPKEEE